MAGKWVETGLSSTGPLRAFNFNMERGDALKGGYNSSQTLVITDPSFP